MPFPLVRDRLSVSKLSWHPLTFVSWFRECLLDAYSVSECPNCSKQLLTTSHDGRQQLLCHLNNEGGLQENYNILDVLTEEAYLRAYPEERKCRAFLEFCKEGDVEAVVALIRGGDDSEDEDESEQPVQEGKPIDVLRYQDPMGDEAGQSGLHKAVVGGSREVAWLLLLLASNLDYSQFPPQVMQEAAAVGLMRDDQDGKADIRSLTDAQGRTAEQLAAEMDGVWHGWPGTGRLAI
jgi:hypothetical protein